MNRNKSSICNFVSTEISANFTNLNKKGNIMKYHRVNANYRFCFINILLESLAKIPLKNAMQFNKIKVPGAF